MRAWLWWENSYWVGHRRSLSQLCFASTMSYHMTRKKAVRTAFGPTYIPCLRVPTTERNLFPFSSCMSVSGGLWLSWVAQLPLWLQGTQAIPLVLTLPWGDGWLLESRTTEENGSLLQAPCISVSGFQRSRYGQRQKERPVKRGRRQSVRTVHRILVVVRRPAWLQKRGEKTGTDKAPRGW